jgi:Zn-dependent alcohol dehydrogenase|tara:strand:+ start:979 stop:2094 length:1116 start_codon:yes stop_codon:yes gene_type:complete
MSKLITNAAVLREAKKPLSFEELTIDSPNAGEVRIELRSCGVCHTDYSLAKGILDHQPIPSVLGHEGAGIIIDVGAGVSNVKKGDHVVMAPIAPCGQCSRCLNSEGAYCKREEERGWGILPDGRTPLKDKNGEGVAIGFNTGFYSDYAVVPCTAVAKISTNVSFEIASLLGCAVVSGYGAVVNTAKIEVGSSILVVGLGGVGLSAIMAAKLRGAYPIIGVDTNKERRSLAKEIGCDEVMSADEFNNIDINNFNGGFDTVIEASGAIPAIEKCMSLLRRHGICVYVGAAESTYELKIPHLELVATGKRLSGCLTGEVRPAVDLANLAKLYSAGRLPLDIFISNRRPLDELELAFNDLENGVGLRTLIVWPNK